MGTTNRDSSLITQKRRNIAVNAYYQGFVAANGNNGAISKPGQAGAEIVTQGKLGCVACNVLTNNTAKVLGQSYDPNVSLYPPNYSHGGAGGLTGQS